MASKRNEKVDEFIQALPEDIKEMTESLRGVIHEANENMNEEIKWNMPCFSTGNTNICYLQPAKKHVNLGFYSGAMLQDKDNILEGEGKKMRHIRIKKMEDVQQEKMKALIEEAIEYEA
ncbi:DUF1801 domain-containing protein [Virgibacillus oceani]